MTEEVLNRVKAEKQDEDLCRLLQDLNKWMSYSRSRMSSRYAGWDEALRVFNLRNQADTKDLKAEAKGEPAKMVVPLSYAQVMTFVTYAYTLLKQNPTFFQLNPTGNEDYDISDAVNLLLERDLRKNVFGEKLVQILMDLARFGLTAVKNTWKHETRMVNVTMPPADEVQLEMFSLRLDVPTEIQQEITLYEGNDITVVSPYRLLPDCRLPLTRWREGRFVADEQEYNISYFKELEAQGVVAGTEYIEEMSKEGFKSSRRAEGRFPDIESAWTKRGRRHDENDFMVISTEGWFRLEGKRYGLTTEAGYQNYIITIANDSRIIRIDEAGYAHEKCIYDIAQFLPDQHSMLSMALSDTISALQEVVTWLINSRVIALRTGLERHLVVNPQFIDTTGLTQRSPIIMTRKGAPANAVSNFVQQIQFDDRTQTNIAEAEQLMKIVQFVTGINENAMGQYAPGRRSAAENRAANSGAAARMNFHIDLLWESLLAPLGLKMSQNQRQGFSFETFRKILGETSPSGNLPIEELYSQFSLPDHEIASVEDFFIFDSTSKTERQYIAQALQELLGIVASNPQIASMTSYDITKLIDGINELRGIRNLNRYKRAAEPLAPETLVAAENAAGGNAAPPPDTQTVP